LALDAHQLVDGLHHVHGHADGARLIRYGARDGLPDPPRGVRGELVSARVVELLHGADEAQIALLDEVQEQQAASHVPFGYGHHQSEVGLRELAFGLHILGLDPFGQHHLFTRREQWDFADLLKVLPDGIAGGVVHRQVELAQELLFLGVVLGRLLPVGLDDVDAHVEERGVQLFQIVGGDVQILEQLAHFIGREESFLLSARVDGVEGAAAHSGFTGQVPSPPRRP
jgi:hypothetical protein